MKLNSIDAATGDSSLPIVSESINAAAGIVNEGINAVTGDSSLSIVNDGIKAVKGGSSISNLYDSQLAAYLQNDISIFTVVPIVSGSILLFKLAVYWKMQFISAGIVSGVPLASRVVELDAQDGKNVFYLPKGAQYTAVMSPGLDITEKADKVRQKNAINEQLIMESIGKANRGNLNLSGKVRVKTQDIPSKSVDCVLSVGAMDRTKGKNIELVNEVYRMLRPGGLFVFCEPDGKQTVISNIMSIFPETIKGTASAGQKARDANDKREMLAEAALLKKTGKKMVGYQNVKEKKRSRGINQIEAELAGSGNKNVSAFAAEELIEETAEDSSSSVDVDALYENSIKLEIEKIEIENGSEKGSEKTNKNGSDRPGISFERIQNIFDPYVTGIAVRP
eukprot:CAMPEP_0119043518 /NCGR_PEP_ID=MMETSP1177-20130426/22906_1 /TAXON_ID=2985 /ORGANISM="Ochromonas sp, Strain CCMP1899" /LENGTH=392 /DNA_ID=CAMNT_0007011773 /DNA_START=152 /DNA_END=1330 /DNA_ORIENTATION=-